MSDVCKYLIVSSDVLAFIYIFSHVFDCKHHPINKSYSIFGTFYEVHSVIVLFVLTQESLTVAFHYIEVCEVFIQKINPPINAFIAYSQYLHLIWT